MERYVQEQILVNPVDELLMVYEREVEYTGTWEDQVIQLASLSSVQEILHS